jgi:two-component system phosphate regulon sensor histidine kinase PhoR
MFAAALGVALAGVLLFAPQLVAESIVSRSVYLLLWLVAVAGMSAVPLVLHRQERKTAERCLDLLCRLDPHDLASDPETRALPTLPQGHAWHNVFHRVRECLLDYGRRLEEAEHARASAEVRIKRLADDRDHVNEILTCLADPVVAIDNFDELVLANASAEKVLDIQRAGTESRALASLVRCESLVDLLTETRRHKTSTHRTGEVSLVDEQGRQHWYRVTCSTLAAPARAAGAQVDDRSVHGAVAVLNDISGEKATQKRNAEFVSAVSHEMKTPLAGIKAYVELLADGDAEDEQTREEFLGVINSQADRLQRLIDNLLNLARIEAGVVEVDKQLQSLNELLEEAAEVVRPAAEDKDIKLVHELSSMYLGVLADRDMVLQSAINLLSNAIKYTPGGGTVTLRSREVDHDAVFEVADTGVGLSQEDRERVFEKFYRVKKDSQMAPGTGLGLPLARHIVEDVHGGSLRVDSELGKGSVFRVTLPNVGRMNT